MDAPSQSCTVYNEPLLLCHKLATMKRTFKFAHDYLFFNLLNCEGAAMTTLRVWLVGW